MTAESKEEYLNKDCFEQDVKGFLFFVESTPEGTDKAKMVFEFTKETLNKLREGDIVAVESFSTLTPHEEEGTFYTLLEITKTNPTHITIDRLKKFRFMGAVREFLKEATKDFETEDPRLIRDHVYVEAEGITTGYLMKAGEGSPEFKVEPSKPILGRDVGVLKPEIVEKLINQGIVEGLNIGNLYSTYEEKRKIGVKVKASKMITHHYTVFGFTGSGKTNLSAFILSRLIKKENINAIIFDLSDEYTALLADILQEQGIVIVDQEDLPDSLIENFIGEKHEIDILAKELAAKTKKPGVFDSKDFEDCYLRVFKKLIENKRIKAMRTAALVIEKMDFKSFLSKLDSRCTHPTHRSMFEQLEPILQMKLKDDETIEKDRFGNFEITMETLGRLKKIFSDCFIALKWKPEYGIVNIVDGLLKELQARLELAKEEITNENFVTVEWILTNFVKEQHEDKKLAILVSSNRGLMSILITELIERSLLMRRKAGAKSHEVLFVIDEGHEFVPNPRETALSDEERQCSRVIERLTRMGRKYGLGVCIASQRVAYLNTTALSNCHTTFIGSLPRKYDRDTMNEAYAVSPEVLNRVVTFPPGNWYVVSSIAMGINNVPIWIVSPNREKDLAEFFNSKGYLSLESINTLKDIGYIQ